MSRQSCKCAHCEICIDKRYVFGEIDHIDGNPANNDLLNGQLLCRSCHHQKTQIEENKQDHLKVSYNNTQKLLYKRCKANWDALTEENQLKLLLSELVPKDTRIYHQLMAGIST